MITIYLHFISQSDCSILSEVTRMFFLCVQVVNIDALRGQLPELPHSRRERLQKQYDVSAHQSMFIVVSFNILLIIEYILIQIFI